MANPFDQFDEVEEGNPFDQFDVDPKVEAKKAGNRKVLSAGERFLAGVRAPLDGGTQFAAKANKFLSDATGGFIPRLKKDPLPEIEQRRAAYEAGKPEGFDIPHFIGEMVSPANLALAVVPGGGVVKAAAMGAASGALEPVAEGEDFATSKARQMAIGAAGGGALHGAARTVGRFLSPNAAQNQRLQLLKREGVRPTIGQALGGRASKAEEKLMSVPIFGDAIGLARDRSRRQFNQAALNRVTDTVGAPRVREVGQEGIREAGDRVSAVYNDADALLNTPHAPRADRQTLRDIQAVIRRAQQGGLPQMHQDTLRALLNEVGTDVSRFGTIRDFKRIDSRLGERASHFGKSGSAYERDLGTAIGDVQRALREGVMRRRPQAGVLNTMADDAYGNLVRVENAGNKAALTGGNFTPGQLLQSIKQGDPRIRHRGFARGEARMQDLAQAGQEVLGSTVPNSGTADRLLLPSLARGATSGTGLGVASAVDPTGASQAVLAALGGGAAAYTPIVQRLLVAAASSRPQEAAAAREALRRIAPHLAVPGAVGANSFFAEE